jgi:hypothetical protein
VKTKPKQKTSKVKNTAAPKKLMSRKGILIFVFLFALVGSFFTLSSFAATSLKPVKPNSRFAWLLQGSPNESIMDNETGPKVYDFDYTNSNAAQISRLEAKGITTICYFSAGTDEDWRPDHNQFKAGDTYGQLPGWEGELIVDTRSANVRSIMYNRIQTMSNMGCDGIEPDNIDAYTNSNSIPLNETTTLDYMQFLVSTAHNFNMSIALKNGGDLVNKKLPGGQTVVQAFDFAVVEQCYEYSECDSYRPFVTANKAVFIVEYKGSASSWASSASCKDANSKNYDAYLMNLNLNGPRTPCRTSGGESGGGGTTPPANLPPAVSITSPVNNQQFAAGASVEFAANASDSDGSISQVEFFNGTVRLAVDTSAPYSTSIASLPAGTYNLRTVARDNTSTSNNTATSSVTVTVLSPTSPPPTANILPVVTIQTPPATAFAPANFTLMASASDQDGSISRVEFFQGSTLVGSDNTAPYSFAVADYPVGTYSFSAKAYDNTGTTAQSRNVQVIVTSAATNPPPVNGTEPVWPAGATMKKGFDTYWWSRNCAFQSTCKVYVQWPYAKDNVKVTGYEVWRAVDSSPAVKLYVNAPNDPYYTDRISKNRTYTYSVYAVDDDGNRVKGPSTSLKIKCYVGVCKL